MLKGVKYLLKVMRKDQHKKNSTEDKRVCRNAIFRIFINIFIKSDAKRSTQKNSTEDKRVCKNAIFVIFIKIFIKILLKF